MLISGKVLDNETALAGKPNNDCTIKMHQLLHTAYCATILRICILPNAARLTMSFALM